MAYTAPNSTIRLMKNVPLPESGIYTVWWDSDTQQESYFSGKTKYTCNNYTYSRKEREVVKVGYTIDDLYDVNYMAFKNTSYENKWFYAWVTDAEYINDGCTAIHFKIDPMQTWWKELKGSSLFGMVKRCHSQTDEIGDNTVPENISLNGDYIQVGNTELETTSGDSLSDYIAILAICDTDGYDDYTPVWRYDGIMSGSRLYAASLDSDGVTYIRTVVRNFVDKPDAIVNFYIAPKFLANNHENEPIPSITRTVRYVQADAIQGTEPFGLNGFYVPKNKKLYTYPYNYYCVTNTEQTMIIRYEWCYQKQPYFRLTGNLSYPPSLLIRPTRYGLQGAAGYNTTDGRSMTQSLVLNQYPQCSLACDAFENWVATSAAPTIASTVSSLATSVATGIAGGLVMGPVGIAMGVASGVSNIAQGLSDIYTASRQADIQCGSTAPSPNVTDEAYAFWGCRMCVDEDTAQMIDYYFTKYGYAQNKLMTINPDVRPSFYHVETDQLNLMTPAIPANYQQDICNRFDNGVTFWKDPDQVGNFNLDNSV